MRTFGSWELRVTLANAAITEVRLARHRDDPAAAAWRSVLDGTVSPDTLPLLAETQSQRRHEHHWNRHRDASTVDA